MDTLKSAAHLRRELGEDLFSALVSSDNTAAVREFAKTLMKNALPTTMTLGGRTYEILGFLRGDETSVGGSVMVGRAGELNANLGKDDCEHVLAHQSEIPAALRGKVAFVFPDWRHPGDLERVACVCWYDDRWIQYWAWLDDDWHDDGRVLCRK